MYSSAKWCRNLMSGTVVTPKSAISVARAGCTHIRVGLGSSSAYSTSIATGCGVPSLSAVFEIWSTFQSYMEQTRPKIIADGSVRTTGDIIKYLSAGADAVMIGNLLSPCIESPNWQINKMKKILNFFSFGLLCKNYMYKKYKNPAYSIQHPTNTVDNFLNQTKASFASALNYLGLTNIKDLNPYNVEFIRISSASYKESRPHLLD